MPWRGNGVAPGVDLSDRLSGINTMVWLLAADPDELQVVGARGVNFGPIVQRVF
jgi:hypothetical protein